MSPGTCWRTRLRACALFADHLLAQADALISARLDIRPIRNTLSDIAAWWGRTWRHHLHTAHVRRYGPGRGLLVVTTDPTDEEIRER